MDFNEKKAYAILDWAKEQISMYLHPENKVQKVFNNCIYKAHLGEGIGSEQSLDRPVLVVDSYKTSSVCVVIPLTNERLGDKFDFHVDLECGAGTALVEQIRAISKTRIYDILRDSDFKSITITEGDREKINDQLSKICHLKELRDMG